MAARCLGGTVREGAGRLSSALSVGYTQPLACFRQVAESAETVEVIIPHLVGSKTGGICCYNPQQYNPGKTRDRPCSKPGFFPGYEQGGVHTRDANPGFETPGYTREGPYPISRAFLGFWTTATVARPRDAETGRAFDRACGHVRAPVKARATLSRGSPSRHDACLHRCRHAHHKEEQRRARRLDQAR